MSRRTTAGRPQTLYSWHECTGSDDASTLPRNTSRDGGPRRGGGNGRIRDRRLLAPRRHGRLRRSGTGECRGRRRGGPTGRGRGGRTVLREQPGSHGLLRFDDPSRSLRSPLVGSASTGATLEIEPSTFRSAPHALHCVVPTSPGGRARARYDLLTAPRNISLSFGIYVASAPLTRATLIHLNLNGPTGFWQTGLSTATNGSTFDVFEYGEDNGTITASDAVPIVPQTTGKWLRVRVSIRLDEGGVAATEIDIDGTKMSKPLSLPPWVASAVAPTFILGIGYLDKQPLGDIYLDDILIDVQ